MNNSSFLSKWATKFADNTTRAITEAFMRDFRQDISDSFLNLVDHIYTAIRGTSPGINTITGLKAITTASLSVGVTMYFRDTSNADVLRSYELVSGTDAEVSPVIIRPTDYAGGTNEKVWKLIRTDSITAWDMSTNSYPANSYKGQQFSGTELTTRTTLVDSVGNPLPTNVLAISLQDNATLATHFLFIIPIY